MKKFTPQFEAYILPKINVKVPANVKKFFNSPRLHFISLWSFIYFIFLMLFSLINKVFNLADPFPQSITYFVNSSWGGFVVLALLCTVLLLHYYPNSIFIKDLLSINSNHVSFSNNNLIVSVFCCQPPILHTRTDFSFFLTNFQPLSIEIDPIKQTIHIIIYGSHLESFENKIQECHNHLNSLFSKVTLLSDLDLKNFISNGNELYKNYGNGFEHQYFHSLKSLRSKYIKNSTPQMANSLIEHPIEKTDRYDIYLLMLYKSKNNKPNLTSSQSNFFRGIRVGSSFADPNEQVVSRVRIKINELRNFFLSSFRLPEKNYENEEIAELEKNYFFILHKHFNYYFKDITDKNTSKDELLTQETVNTTIIDQKSSKTINIPFSIPQKVTLPKKIKINEPDSVSLHETKILEPNKLNHKPKLKDGKQIIFQFTYFCQYFCPIMNSAFKNLSSGIKKDFTIPEGCYDHVSLADNNIDQFLQNQDNPVDIRSVFTHNDVQEKFFEYIQEKELKIIDKICHFSSIILLSPNTHEINDQDVLNFIKNLEGDYFIT